MLWPAVDVPSHSSSESSPAARGQGLGRALAGPIASNVAIYRRLFGLRGLSPAQIAGFGRRALERIGEWYPELAEEIEGIARGAGLPVADVAALNARTELLAFGRGECTTVACTGAATASAEPLGMQTWDWHEELSGGWCVWTIAHTDGPVVRTLTEAGIVGKIGVSDAGVGVLLNILGHDDDGPPMGVPVHILNRGVLDRARTGVEALRMLSTARVSASSAVTVVAADEDDGIVCTVELSPAGPGFVTPNRNGVVIHTNHFLADPGRGGDRMVREGPDSVLRHELARRRLARRRSGIDEAAVLEVLASHRGGDGAICCHPAVDAPFGDRFRTLATVTIEPAAAMLRVRAGGPCEALTPRQPKPRQGSRTRATDEPPADIQWADRASPLPPAR